MPTILDHPTLLRIRRNHALEHATIHLLSTRVPRTVLIGRSDARGFYLAGEISTDALQQTVHQALARLQGAGESGLAVHPNCGTNLMTGAILAGSASFLVAGMTRHRRWSDWLDQWPAALLAAALGLVVAQPVGYGDGLRRVPGNQVIIDGIKCPAVGSLCLDQMMVQLPCHYSVGEDVIIVGQQAGESIWVHNLAALYGTSQVDFTTLIHHRVPRIYV